MNGVVQRKSEGPVSTAWLKLPPPSLKHIETPPLPPLKKYKKINKLNLPIKTGLLVIIYMYQLKLITTIDKLL